MDVNDYVDRNFQFVGVVSRKHRREAGPGMFRNPLSASSDAHTPWEIGLSYTEMPPFEGPSDFLTGLGKGKLAGRSSFIGYHFLSTWAKVRWRLHLGGRVAR